MSHPVAAKNFCTIEPVPTYPNPRTTIDPSAPFLRSLLPSPPWPRHLRWNRCRPRLVLSQDPAEYPSARHRPGPARHTGGGPPSFLHRPRPRL